MYGETTQLANQSPSYTNEATTTGEPLTAEILQHAKTVKDAAMHAHSRLWALRDRLYMTPANAPTASGDPPKAPQSFTEAWRAEARCVETILAEVCGLANELSNRL